MGKQALKMADRVSFVTQSRDDIFSAVYWFMSAIAPEFLTVSQKPLNFYVNGTFASGKKIVPEAARDFFLPDYDFTGTPDHEEHYKGNLGCDTISISFINVASPKRYSFYPSILHVPFRVAKKHLVSEREYGGINFIHNSDVWGRCDFPAVEFWIEGLSSSGIFHRGSRIAYLESDLKDTFLKGRDNKYIRYFEIKVYNKDLFLSEKFQAVWGGLHLSEEIFWPSSNCENMPLNYKDSASYRLAVGL